MKFKVWIVAVLGITSCYYDNEESLYPPNPSVKIENVSYSKDVVPILQANCYVCHASSVRLGTIDVEGYDDVKILADNGRLLGAISHSPNFKPMPQGNAKLPSILIKKIEIWILEGTKNN
ncbi:MAG: hypothetical protein M3Q56_08365 [Bacteroidota bacterium]|nr:hypothetical protein [Bacteroidota bacterium]